MDTIVTILSLIGAVIIVGIIIMVHEFGHYSIGRLCKIKIVEFAIGFGPKIKSWMKNGIKYSIRWFWVGGFTKFLGEDDELDNPDAFNKQSAGRRALTIAAGPVFNIVLAFILAIIILAAFGDAEPVVVEVWDGSSGEEQGLEVGDVIVGMNDVDIEFWMEVSAAQRNAYDDYIPLTVLRDGQELSFDIERKLYTAEQINEYIANPEDHVDEGRTMGGFSYGQSRKPYGFFEAIGKAFRWIFVLLRESVIGLFAWIAALVGAGDSAVLEGGGGLFKIIEWLGDAIKTSVENVLRIGVAVSISLAIFNIIPFPALDGGRLVFIGIEKVTGKPVPRKVEGFIHFGGFIVLMGLMVLLAYKDIASWFGG